MKPYTSDTYGRNHYFNSPKEHKEHKVPKRAKGRVGTRSGVRQKMKSLIGMGLAQ